MDHEKSIGDFTDAEKAALLTACWRITQLEQERVSKLAEKCGVLGETRRRIPEDRANLAVRQALEQLDKRTRLELESLIIKMAGALRGFTKSFLRGRHRWRWEPEDLVGETCRYIFQNNWRALCHWDPAKGTLKGYLWRSMRYRWLSFLQPGPLTELWASLDDLSIPPQEASPSTEAAREALAQELADRLHKYGLVELDIKLLCMKLLDDLSTEQCAIRLGELEERSVGHENWEKRRTMVCNRLDQRFRRAKDKLSKLLLGEEPSVDSDAENILVKSTGERSQKLQQKCLE